MSEAMLYLEMVPSALSRLQVPRSYDHLRRRLFPIYVASRTRRLYTRCKSERRNVVFIFSCTTPLRRDFFRHPIAFFRESFFVVLRTSPGSVIMHDLVPWFPPSLSCELAPSIKLPSDNGGCV